MDFSSVFAEVVLGWFGRAGLIMFAYLMGKRCSVYKQRWKNYFLVVGMTGLLSLVVWANYGTHFEDDDLIYGGGAEVVGSVPTDKKRNEAALTLFLSLTIPGLVGVYQGKQSSE